MSWQPEGETNVLHHGAIYRFNRTNQLRYYQAACTRSGIEFLYPIQVSGTRIAEESTQGRRYVILYF